MAIKPPEIYLLKRILGLLPILQKNIITIGVDKDGSEGVLEDLIDNKEKPILDQIYDADNLQKLIQCFDVLTSKEKDILIKRYGLNSSKKMTQKEIAKEYHISRSYISRIEKRALIKLLKCYLQEKEG